MMPFQNFLASLCVIHLVPGIIAASYNKNEVTYQPNIIPYKYNNGVYEETEKYLPDSKSPLKLNEETSQRFYDPSYGFSPRVIAEIMADNKDSKTEPVLTAVLLNSKDYYRVFDNYNAKKQFEREENNYQPDYKSNPSSPKLHAQEPAQNVNHYAADDVFYGAENYQEYAKNYPSYNLENDLKYPNVPKRYGSRNFPQQPKSPTEPQRPTAFRDVIVPVEEQYRERHAGLDQLFEEYNVLSEQIQRLRARAEKELKRPRVRSVRLGSHSSRWTKQ